jgi:hypothetical protein
MTAPRVSINDLAGAVDWLRSYENSDGVPIGDGGTGLDDERAVELLRVAEWLDAEIARRQEQQTVRAVAKQAGVSHRQARSAVRRRARSEP